MEDDNARHIVRVYVGALSQEYEALSVEASKHTTAEEIVTCIVQKLGFETSTNYELAEVVENSTGQECKERRIGLHESPVALKLLWPKTSDAADVALFSDLSSTASKTNLIQTLSNFNNGTEQYRFCLREKLSDSLWSENFAMDPQILRDYFYRFLYQPKDKEYPDLCQLPDLNEETLLYNLKSRFNAGHIYSYVGSILIAINPFKFHPIYNPKYVKLYQHRRREELPPHIFSVADVAYYTMLKSRENQCIVISGESGSGKTESTNFLLHHLTSLSQKGVHGSGVEQTILSAGPVLEAFGNAKTAHNNNSSRFGKFIQVNYRENGMVHGAIVQKYLLEKSRICSQAKKERNYHVFYYLLAGANDLEKEILHLLPPHKYHYLNQSGCYTLEGVDESYEFSRLKQSMEMVGFGLDKQRKLFSVLSAVLLLGNIEFLPKKSSYHTDESVLVKNPDVVKLISGLLRVTEATLLAALTSKRARVNSKDGEMLVINYRMPEAIAARDAMAKCLYGALFDWIVLQVNHALLSKKDANGCEYLGKSIGVLDIFGFEDFGDANSFEQCCINYANEQLQFYFNQHVFKYEQEEYRKEGILWTDIEFMDNTPCLSLFESRPNGLICILDDQCSFPGATNETLLQKLNSVHKDNDFYIQPQRKEPAFVIRHYAGKVKYQIGDFREKNMDLMRHDIVAVLKNSSMAFVRELVGIDPVAVFRWAIVRAFFRAYFSFREAGNRQRVLRSKSALSRAFSTPGRRRSSNEQLIKKNRSFRPQQSVSRGIKNLHSVKNLASQTATIGISNKQSYNPRKQPVSVSQQFQQSLNSLMITLNQANPFFIRCIKSNSEKSANFFDDETVQRQLRYTGMLETVRIRQAGYNVRLTVDEFVHLYRILLPSGVQSGRRGIVEFLHSLRLNPVNYQLGKTKIFFRESEKIKLDYFLHQQIMSSIVRIQRWYRVSLERRQFLRIQDAVLKIQSYVRMFLAQRFTANLRMRNHAATYIQKVWRGQAARKWYQNLKRGCVEFQARVRGNILRQKYQQLLEKHKDLQKQKDKINAAAVRSRNESSVSVPSADEEASLSKGSSQEELLDINHRGILESEDDVESAFVKYGGGGFDNEEVRSRTVSLSNNIKSASTSVGGSEKFSSTGALPSSIKNPSPEEVPIVKERSRRRLSLKSRKEKGVGIDQFVEEEFLRAQEFGMGNGTTIDEDNKEQERLLNRTNPFQKAKKHLKTFIGTSNKVKLDKHEAVLLDSESEDDVHPTNSQMMMDYDYSSSRDRVDIKQQGGDGVLRNTNSMNVELASDPNRHKYQTEAQQFQRTNLASYPRDEKAFRQEKEPVKPRRGVGLWASSSSNEVTARISSTPPTKEHVGLYRMKPRVIKRTEAARVSSVDTIMTGSKTNRTSSSATSISSTDMSQQGAKDPAATSKAGRTMSIPNLDTGREVRRTRSVSETRPPIVNSRDVLVNPCPYPYEHEYLGSAKTSSNSSITTTRGSGHTFDKVQKYHKGDSCAACKKTMHFFNPGLKCSSSCQLMFHSKCVQNELSNAFPCSSMRGLEFQDDIFSSSDKSPSTIGRRKSRKPNKNLSEKPGKFSLTGTSEFTDRTDQIISGVRELELMQEFISQKIFALSKTGETGKENTVDRVFQQALKEFKENLVSTFSVACKQGDGKPLNIRYKDLIANFLSIMQTVCEHEGTGNDFPTTMGVNAFRGFLNEFMNSNRGIMDKQKPSKARKTGRKDKGGKRQRLEENITHLGHSFVTTVINIPTVCEVCSSFIMWPIERGVVCSRCKLACHKKCHPKISTDCTEGGSSRNNSSGGGVGGIFGVPLNSLLAEGGGGIPSVVERLVTAIEFYGLRMEGLYRKSGVSSKVRELKTDIEEGKDIDWELYPVHVLTSVFKSFLRELPEPLLTFELYEEFLRAADLSQQEDRIVTIFALLKKLPKSNFDLMERLVFHLARVALYEDKNRMNANSLAIVFAPCILRTNVTRQVQESLNDIARQTMCIETIILSQLKKVKETLHNIESLDSAAHSFATRLNSIRSSKMKSPINVTNMRKPDATIVGSTGSLSTEGSVNEVKSVIESSTPESMSAEEEEEYLTRHIKHIIEEKAMLTSVLPTLSRTPSDEDMLSTDPEGDSPGGSIDDLRREMYPSPSPRQMRAHSIQYSRYEPIAESSSFRGLPAGCSSVLPSLHKNRGPHRKKPTRFVRNISSVDFGEDEDGEPTTSHDDEDKSDVSVNPNNDEGAIMV